MLNGIALNLLGWALNGPLKYKQEGGQVSARTTDFVENALVPDLGHLFGIRESVHLSWLLPLGVIAAAVVWFILRRMRLGYEARAVGSTPGSARAGGISVVAVPLKLFLISGALAGLIGMQQLLADKGYLPVNFISALGFTGIAVAFLGQNNPIGIVFAAIFWGILSRGESALQLETDVPREFVIILQGILILSVMVIYQLARRRLARRQLQAAAMVSGPPDLGPRATAEAVS
jgi:general nucleoside transport system permease protein